MVTWLESSCGANGTNSRIGRNTQGVRLIDLEHHGVRAVGLKDLEEE